MIATTFHAKRQNVKKVVIYYLKHENEILVNQVKRLEAKMAQLEGHSTK